MKAITKTIGVIVGSVTAVAIAFSIASIKGHDPFSTRIEANAYTLTLNSSNGIEGSNVTTTKTQATDSGQYQVDFNYTSCSSLSGGHARILAGGKLVNKDHIRSIYNVTATFATEGELKFRTSYDGATWGGYTSMVSTENYPLGSNPYYIEFSTDGNHYVDVTSIKFSYTCLENPDANGNEVVTNDVYQRISGNIDLTSGDEIVIGAIYPAENDNSWHSLQAEEISGYSYFLQAGDLTLSNSNTVANVTNANDVWTVLTGSSTDKWKLKCGDYYLKAAVSSNNYRIYLTTSYNASTCDWTFEFDSNSNVVMGCNSVYLGIKLYNSVYEFSGFKSTTNTSYVKYIYKKVPGETHIEFDTPVDENGFTATDVNKDTYKTNSIFDNDNGLQVKATFTDGTYKTLSKGGENGYSYVVKDPLGNTIDTSKEFASAGQHTLIVSYKDYIPAEITLDVGEYIYIDDVTASMTTTTFNTAATLNNNLAGNLTATVTLSNDQVVSNIAYSAFEANGLGIKLLNPKGITHDSSKPFGTAGDWTLKVYRLDDESVYYNIGLTVNAIPVETITLNESSYELYPEGTLQLTTTINPTNATNSMVNWSSNNEPIAIVDENGLVTAVSVGIAQITATAADGSGVVAHCSITVKAKPAEPSYSIVTSNTTLKNSDTVAVRTAGSTPEGVTGFNDSKDATVSTTKSEWVEFVIGSASSEGWTLYDSVAGKYIASPTTNEFKYSDTAAVCSVDSEGHIICNSRYLCNNSGNYRFYKNIGSYTPFYVFKIGEGSSATPVYPTSIDVTGTSTITIGQTSQLTVTYTPNDTNVRNVTFSSNNESVATVSSTGLVTGVSNGNARITATAEAASGTVTDYIDITVNPVAVTGVSLNETGANVKVGKTITLVPTISPANATNKNVTWTSSDTSVATVSGGVVTGIAAGSATITVTTVDGNKKATCAVTVESASSSAEETFSITYTDLPANYQTGTTVYTAASGIKFQAYNCAGGYSSKMQFKASSGYLQTTESLELQKLIINDRESNTLTVYASNTANSFSTEITGTNDVYDLTGYNYFKVSREASGAGYCSSLTVITGTPTPTDPTGISLNPSSAEMAPGTSKELTVTYTPSNANQNKEITWTSSNTSVATVDANGKVSVKSTATAGQTATITAKLTKFQTITATFTVTVVAQKVDDHTVLIYICGADLESNSRNRLATGDITEILSVAGQPDDVNIVIETGGANSWASTYGISSTNLERWHVENKKLVKDQSLTYASMGASSTLQSFIEYGLNNYPAERTGLILWNHGGAMRGVCYDEKKNDDCLLADEVTSAVSGALSNCGKSGEKLEWIGYDACLMQVQDIASVNSDYFNYMIASEESEAGYGWDYDTWVDDLYAHKATSTILTAVVDGFIKDNGGASSTSSDQTLSYLNLSYMSAYVTAWNNMATQLGTKLNSGNKSSFNNLVKSCKYYADSDYTYYGIFDAKDFINKLAANSTFNPGSTYTNAVLSAHSNLVAYSVAQKGAGESYGLCMFWSVSSNCQKGTYYTAAMTKFTAWRTLVTTYGY